MLKGPSISLRGSSYLFSHSLTSPCGHLYNTDISLLRTVRLVPEKCQKSYIPYLYNTDTSVKRTLGSVLLVSVLKRFDCIPIFFDKPLTLLGENKC